MKNYMQNYPWLNPFVPARRLLLFFALILTISGCQTDQFPNTPPQSNPDLSKSPAQSAQPMVLREGDTLSVSIPSSPSLDTTQQIRTDGKIVLPLIGEVTAAGKSPEDLQNELLKLYQPQVTAKQVIVTVQSPNIPVYVTGAVLRPAFQPDDIRFANPRFTADAMQRNQALLAVIRRVAGLRGATLAQVAIAWTLAQGPHVLAIPGTKRVGYLEENCRAAELELTREDLAELDAMPQATGGRY